jgi:anion-transporting  ArsA/GET3 family ATPase
MPVRAVVVNMVQPEQDGCPYCGSRREVHLRQLDRIRTLVGPVRIIAVESTMGEPRGLEALGALADTVWSAEERMV